LNAAIYSADLESVRVLLESGIDLNSSPPILEMAISTNTPANLEIIQELIRHGADVNAADGKFTPMLMATIRKRPDILAELQKHGASDAGVKEYLMAEASARGDLQEINRLFVAGAPINGEEQWGRTPLMAAIEKGQEAAVDQLIQLGADIRYHNVAHGTTPLMVAASSGQENILKILLSKNVPVDDRDQAGTTAFMFAVTSGKWNVLKILADAGADVNAVRADQRPALSQIFDTLPFTENHVRTIEAALDLGANPNLKTGYNPLDLALRSCNRQVVKALRARGALLFDPLNLGSGLNNAIEKGNLELVQCYLDAGYDEKVRTDTNWFQMAARAGNLQIVQIFLQRGMPANLKNQYGASVLDFAVDEGTADIVRELLKAGAVPKQYHIENAAMRGKKDVVELLQSAGLQSSQLPEITTESEITKLISAGKSEEALSFYRNHESKFRPARSAELLFSIASIDQKNRRYDRAESLLNEIVEKFRGTWARVAALYALAQIEEARKNMSSAIELYRKAAQTSAISYSQMDRFSAPSVRSEAALKLASYYESIGDCKSAIEWWQQYQSYSWCGNEQAAAENWRIHKIAVCKIQMGQREEGIAMLEKSAFGFEANDQSAIDLVDYYNEKGELEALENKLKTDHPEFATSTNLMSSYIRLIHMEKNRRVDEIWKFFDGRPPGTWLMQKAMDSFVRLRKQSEPFALRKLDENGIAPLWASMALGKMRARSALPKIISLMRVEQNIWSLKNYCSALALMDDPKALEVLKGYAESGEGNHKAAATEALQQIHNP
jgi:ankyrin repeat protein